MEQKMEVVILTGMSGAGKTNAVNWFEDRGYYCIDNMPPALIANFLDLTMASRKKIEKAAFVVDTRGGGFFDATKECIKITKNNKLTQANMDRIVETFESRAEIEHFAHIASYDEIVGNDYNLSVSTYVEAEDTREKVDIKELNARIAEIVAREAVLRAEIDKIIAEIENDN